jgi:DNA primase
MSRISQKTIDQVFQAMNIVEVVEEFVTLRKAGTSYKGLCPFHDEKTPSFSVSPTRNTYHCFGCGEGGGPVNFLMNINNWSYRDAICWLAKKYNIEVEETEPDPKAREQQHHKDDLYALNQWANDFFQKSLHDTPEGQSIGLAYLRNRGVRDDIIQKFQIGYSPSLKKSLYNAAMANRFPEENLVETGLCIRPEKYSPYDRFHDRIVFPVRNYLGKIVGFGGRILQKNDNVGKYVNSPDSLVYNKSQELYGLFLALKAIRKFDCCYFVEGYMDVISMHQCGVENVVASSGTSLTNDQVKLIKRYTKNVTLLFDGDGAGIKAALRGIDMFLEQGFNVKVLLLPDGDDPDSFSKKHTAQEFVEYVDGHQVDFVKFKASLLLDQSETDIYKRNEIIHGIADSIARIDDSTMRALFVREAASLTAIPEENMTETVNSHRNQLALQKRKEELQPSGKKVSAPGGTNIATNRPANKKMSLHDKAELKLMKYIVRFGELPIKNIGPSSDICFAAYIKQLADTDGVTISSPVYSRIIEEVIQKHSLPNFKAANYLLAHQDDEVRELALALSIDKNTTISVDEQSTTNNLKLCAEKLVVDVEIAILDDKIEEISHQIHSNNLSGEEISQKLKEIKDLKQARVYLR